MKIKPSYPEFERMVKKGNLIPVYREFLADIDTPVSAYLKIRDDSYSYLLESADGGSQWGRYSFIGYKPFLQITSHDLVTEIVEHGKSKVLKKKSK